MNPNDDDAIMNNEVTTTIKCKMWDICENIKL